MLNIEHLTKTYPGGKVAVRDLSIHVAPGDIYGFIGHNGAGKTTTLKCVAGILKQDAGVIRINGRDLNADPMACKRDMAYIPDNPDLYDHLTGIQYLNFIADIYGVTGQQRTQAIGEYADAFEITANLGDLLGSYSHGMKQKLAIISALIHSPRLMLLDEPFVGLDPKAAVTLKTIMRRKCAEGCAIFFSTHVLDVAQKLCNKVAIIRDGELVVSGDTETLTGDKSLEDVFMEVVEGDTGN